VSQTSPLRALRGRLLWFVADPHDVGEAAHRYVADGVLVIEGGVIRAVGPAEAILPTLPAGAEITDHRPHLIMPGFIDAHLHMPQTQVIASYGAQLMDWLERYTFVEEQKYWRSRAIPKSSRTFLLDELLQPTAPRRR
jgi:guanine deaminase